MVKIAFAVLTKLGSELMPLNIINLYSKGTNLTYGVTIIVSDVRTFASEEAIFSTEVTNITYEVTNFASLATNLSS